MSNMNCNEFENARRHAVESRTAVLSESLRAHSERCEDCAASVAADAVLARSLPEWLSAVPPTDLTDSVLNQWRSELAAASVNSTAPAVTRRAPKLTSTNSETSRNSRAPGRGMTIVAAVCLLAIAPLIVSTSVSVEHNPMKPLSGVVAHRNAEPNSRRVVSPATAPAPEIDGIVRNVGSAYLGLAYDVRDTLSDAAVLISEVDLQSEAAATDGDLVPPTKDVPRGEWTNEFKPIGRKVGKAFGFLLEAIPTDGFTSI